MLFSDWAKKTRKLADLTQVQLAGKMGVDPQTISRLERGEVDSNDATIRLWAITLGVSPDEALARSSGKYKEPEPTPIRDGNLSDDVYSAEVRLLAARAGLPVQEWIKRVVEKILSVPIEPHQLIPTPDVPAPSPSSSPASDSAPKLKYQPLSELEKLSDMELATLTRAALDRFMLRMPAVGKAEGAKLRAAVSTVTDAIAVEVKRLEKKKPGEKAG